MKVAINGAGIAGPTLAYWLRRAGHEPVLIEAAPSLRTGGYTIDFWGIGYDVAAWMGIEEAVRTAGYRVGEIRLVDARGRRRGGFSANVFRRMVGDRFTSIRRGALAREIYRTIDGEVETLFADSIAAIEEHDAGVRVSFERAPPRDFDLVVGADGLHSRVRNLAFGPQRDHEVYLGYKVAAFEVEGYRPRDPDVYISHAVPGRQVSRFSMRGDRTLVLFVWRDEDPGTLPGNDAKRRGALRAAFAGVGWECPAMLAAMEEAGEIYFDRVSQIRMNSWTKGRTALVGDAAACVSLLAGEGTGLAMAEAYVLAGELARTGGDYPAAFAAYEARLMPFLAGKQESAASFASSFVPKTALGILARRLATRLMAVPAVADFFLGGLRDDIELPDYFVDR